MREIIRRCECCDKELIQVMSPTQKYCSFCSLHTKGLRQIIGRLKYKTKLLEAEKYKRGFYKKLKENTERVSEECQVSKEQSEATLTGIK